MSLYLASLKKSLSCACAHAFVCHFSVRGQRDAGGGSYHRYAQSRRRGADGFVPARRPARSKPAAPDSVHARATVPVRAGVRQGELRLQTTALRAGHGAQLTGDHHKGTDD